ncbi:hypothetical protein [Bacillus andreraoultii]|uniref:hypothetical protein n=1 Tax=Bacillus andreraoultii TaxID=1499685 RepID=UPI00053A2918|nr:hypothetical protein [Bacillus andreraoultii]
MKTIVVFATIILVFGSLFTADFVRAQEKETIDSLSDLQNSLIQELKEANPTMENEVDKVVSDYYSNHEISDMLPLPLQTKIYLILRNMKVHQKKML